MINLNKNNQLLIGIIIALFYFISLSNYFYEVSVYKHFVGSIIHDFDLNILNQVSKELRIFMTESGFHPTHHSVIQTPVLALGNFIELILNYIFGEFKELELLTLSSTFLNIISLLIGLYFTNKISRKINSRDLSSTAISIYFFSTSILMFSLFTFNVLEVFTFPLTSYIFFSSICKPDPKENLINKLIQGSLCGLLFITKIIYLPICIISLFNTLNRKEIKNLVIFSIGFLIIILIHAFYTKIVYGVYFSSSSLTTANIICEYTFENFFRTISLGSFTNYGIFLVNPVYLLSFFSFFYFYSFKEKKFTLIETIILSCWVLFGIYYITFMIGNLTDDQFPGRMALSSLSIFIIGFDKLFEKLTTLRQKVITALFLIIPQIFFTLNFMALYSEGHYKFIKRKYLDSSSQLFSYLIDKTKTNFEIFLNDFIPISFFILITVILIIKILNNLELIKKVSKYYFIFIILGFISIHTLNFVNYKKNISNFPSKLTHNVAISNDINTLMFIYFTDVFELISINNPEKINLLNNRRKNYYLHIKKNLIKSSDYLDKKLNNLDFANDAFR